MADGPSWLLTMVLGLTVDVRLCACGWVAERQPCLPPLIVLGKADTQNNLRARARSALSDEQSLQQFRSLVHAA